MRQNGSKSEGFRQHPRKWASLLAATANATPPPTSPSVPSWLSPLNAAGMVSPAGAFGREETAAVRNVSVAADEGDSVLLPLTDAARLSFAGLEALLFSSAFRTGTFV